MKKCPRCGHNRFIVSAHVVQTWIVDELGFHFKTVSDRDEVTHYPADDDIWVCESCGYDGSGEDFNVKEEKTTEAPKTEEAKDNDIDELDEAFETYGLSEYGDEIETVICQAWETLTGKCIADEARLEFVDLVREDLCTYFNGCYPSNQTDEASGEDEVPCFHIMPCEYGCPDCPMRHDAAFPSYREDLLEESPEAEIIRMVKCDRKYEATEAEKKYVREALHRYGD